MGIRLRIYEAIRHERAQVLNPQSCESTESRNGYSNGRKFKSVVTVRPTRHALYGLVMQDG